MRVKVASTLAMAVTSALFMMAAPAPSIAGSGGRVAAGFGIGVVVGAVIASHAARAGARPSARPARSQTATRPVARPERAAKSEPTPDAKTADQKPTVHQIDQRSTAANATTEAGSHGTGTAGVADPFAGAKPAQQPAQQAPSGQ